MQTLTSSYLLPTEIISGTSDAYRRKCWLNCVAICTVSLMTLERGFACFRTIRSYDYSVPGDTWCTSISCFVNVRVGTSHSRTLLRSFLPRCRVPVCIRQGSLRLWGNTLSSLARKCCRVLKTARMAYVIPRTHLDYHP